QVSIQRDHEIAFALLEAGHDRRVLAVVAVEDDRDYRAAITLSSLEQYLGRVVTTAVVNQNDFVGLAHLRAGRFGTAQQFRQALFLVVDRDNDRHAVDGVRFHERTSTMDSMALTTRSTSA
nr:hypothetical protein [Tanacetum cinerariifolium]